MYTSNENKIYYENHLTNDFDRPENKRIKADVDIICNLSSARTENNLLCDAYTCMTKLKPFKEKYKNYKINKYYLRKK